MAQQTKQGSSLATADSRATAAKASALAAGAGLAGLAGGLALANRSPKHKLGQNLVDAAEKVGSFGEGMGSLAEEIRRVREGVAEAGEPKRSPIEIVLQGLTRRR
jgi:hypothetical protein